MKIMKAKYILIALLTLTFFGCDDNTGNLGLGMFPGSDQGINGKLTTFNVITGSIPTGEIYAKTNIGYVGKFTDATFGTYTAGFLATLNCPAGLTFPAVYEESTVNGKKTGKGSMVVDKNDKDITLIYDENDPNKVIGNIHTVELRLWYSSYFGDSLTACRLSVYELGKDLKLDDKNNVYYTNINPQDYNLKELLGRKAYTAVDLSVKDSIRNLSSYVPSVYLNFEKDVANTVGGGILQKSRTAGSNFNQSSFIDKFKGIYVKSDYGDGTVLYVFQVQMNVVYKRYAVDADGVKLPKKIKDQDGTDSTYYDYRPFTSTREVIQANQLQNDKTAIDKLIAENNCTYLKSPAGIFTQATLPIKTIENQLAGDTLNAVKLTFSNYNQSSDKKFGMSIPSNVMLIRKRFRDSFFEKNLLSDGVSSFLTSHTSSTNQYTFSNITKLINACVTDRATAIKELKEKKTAIVRDEKGNLMKDKEGKDMIATTIEEWETLADWDKVVLIPILVTYDSSSNSGYGTPNIISIQHDLKPGYVRLKGGSDANGKPISDEYKLKLEVVSTNFATTK